MTTPFEDDVVLTVRGRKFYALLKSLRESAGLTQAQAAGALGTSRPRLGRLEMGASPFKVNELANMLDLYGCPQHLRLGLLDLAPQLQKRGLLTSYDDVIDYAYSEIELAATDIRTYQMLLVPGLLQTPEYSMALMSLYGAEGEELHRRVAARASRRKRLAAADGPTFHAIIAETALTTPIGGEEVLREQLRALVNIATQPRVMIQVIETQTWEHPGHEGSFVVFGFGGPSALDVAYFEGAAGSQVYLEKPNQVELCSVNFDRISKAALPQSQSVELIEGLLV